MLVKMKLRVSFKLQVVVTLFFNCYFYTEVFDYGKAYFEFNFASGLLDLADFYTLWLIYSLIGVCQMNDLCGECLSIIMYMNTIVLSSFVCKRTCMYFYWCSEYSHHTMKNAFVFACFVYLAQISIFFPMFSLCFW